MENFPGQLPRVPRFNLALREHMGRMIRDWKQAHLLENHLISDHMRFWRREVKRYIRNLLVSSLPIVRSFSPVFTSMCL